MLRRSLLRRVCPDGQQDLLLPESAVRPVWPYGAIRPVEVSRLASACRTFSLSDLPRVSVGAHWHGDGKGGGALLVPYYLAENLVELATALRGAARYRTPVL